MSAWYEIREFCWHRLDWPSLTHILSADTLYICYCIDKDMGSRHREEVFEAVSIPL